MPAPTIAAVKSDPPRPKRGGHARLGGSDEAAHHHHVILRQRRNRLPQAGVGFRIQRVGVRVPADR